MENNKSCYKCGKIGHEAADCTETTIILDMKSYEERVQKEIETTYSNALQNKQYQRDEFGPFFPDPSAEKNIGHNWLNDVFCYNCGEHGHTMDQCRHPLYGNFYEKIQEKLETENKNDPDHDGLKVKKEFEKIWNNQ